MAATIQSPVAISVPSTNALSALAYRPVYITGGTLTLATGTTHRAIGLLLNDPLAGSATTPLPSTVVVAGKAKAVAGGTVTAGSPVTSAAAGIVDAAVGSGQCAVGIAVTGTTVSGVVVEIVVCPHTA